MQQNNDFLLRVPSAGFPFRFSSPDCYYDYSYPTNYAYSGL